jgi:plastocyanin
LILAPAPPVVHVAATTTIRLVDNKFRPAHKDIRRRTLVRFVWAGSNPHNVFVFDGPRSFHSRTQTSGTYSKRLTRKGVYHLGCTIHAGMLLTIKVR